MAEQVFFHPDGRAEFFHHVHTPICRFYFEKELVGKKLVGGFKSFMKIDSLVSSIPGPDAILKMICKIINVPLLLMRHFPKLLKYEQ